MFEAINPAYWWGATAISVPIIIHLINRLRYRRIRWAAMEFLLKSQQRNRRKLILEQLLLLAARCCIVLLLVVFLVRPTGCLDQAGAGSADWPTYHVAVLDDSLSMQDVEEPRNPESATAFTSATRLLSELARKYADASSAHYLTVLRFSTPEAPEFGKPFDQLGGAPPGQQLTADEARKLKERLDALRCGFAPQSPLKALQEAARYFDNVKEGHKVLHVFSDFRRRDWTEGGEADQAAELLAGLARSGKVQVRLHDLAQPRRSTNPNETPRAHLNLGIVDLSARSRLRLEDERGLGEAVPTRIVTPGLPLYLHVAIRNFSDTERSGIRLQIRVDGVERTSKVLDRLAGGEEAVVVFDLTFSPEEPLGFKQITAVLEDPERQDHLYADNSRFTYVELRKEVPVLLVDPDVGVGEPPPASYYLMKALTGSTRSGLRPERINPREFRGDEVVVLDAKGGKDTRRKIEQYPVIFLLNISGIGEGTGDLHPDGLKALETYVRRGGSVVFFLGERTNVVSFNRDLYKNGQGIFAVPLLPRPEANRADAFVDDPPDETDSYAKLRLLRANHPAFPFRGELAKLLTDYLTINRYFRVDPSWQAPESVAPLVQLANRKPLSQYVNDARDLANRLEAAAPASLAERIRNYTDRIREWIQV
ncbi:MAG: BatA domain-containing protein, partial [Gemmatales bacterium]|nr:BatA domain-containing protein [Gemmatales bacterium]MDW8388341.1 BatA domain-containing protein [Gemmatales bacterium]